jgi:hypothetical protein
MPEAKPPGEPAANSSSNPAAFGPFRLTISIDRTEFAGGEPVLIRARIENTSPAEATYWVSGFWPNHRVSLVDENGRLAPRTEEGRKRDAAFSPGGARDKNVPQVLRPGQAYEALPPIRVDRLFELRPGNYRVQLVYHEAAAPTPACAVSNELQFRVAGNGSRP